MLTDHPRIVMVRGSDAADVAISTFVPRRWRGSSLARFKVITDKVKADARASRAA
jgi:hypothetical protein